MNIVEEATKRLEQLSRAGVAVPWSAAGLEQSDLQARVDARPRPVAVPAPGGSVRRAPIEAVPSPPSSSRRVESRFDAGSAGELTLDLEHLARSGHLVPADTRSTLAEEFRRIKRPLLENTRREDAAAERLRLIMVTSAVPGEGKTFCAINLAMSIAAEIDTSVLLIDADVVRPSLLQRLGVRSDKGLLEVLADPHMDLSRVILKTNVPKLSIVPAGAPNAVSTELLASDGMERLLVSLAEDCADRVVIFDTPPLLLTNEAEVLASRVGQVVLVVEASATPRKAVVQALRALEDCPHVMTVLNKANRPARRLGYGYGYGYRHGHSDGPAER